MRDGEVAPSSSASTPDAPELPDDDYQKIAARRGRGFSGRWAPRNTGRRSRHLHHVRRARVSQHRMGLTSGAATSGRYPPPAIWAGSNGADRRSTRSHDPRGWRTFFAITEPSGGADPAGAIQCRASEARRQAGVLNGRKVFISNAHNGKWDRRRHGATRRRAEAASPCFHPGAGHARLHREADQGSIRTSRDPQRRRPGGL